MELSLTVLALIVAAHVAVVVVAIVLVKKQFNIRRKYPSPAPNTAIVVTGASSGIGFSAAVHLANEGHTVYAGFRNVENDTERVAKLQAAVKDATKILPISIDVTNPVTVTEAAARVEAETEGAGIVGLVNCAGFNAGPYPIEFVEIERLNQQLDVNVVGQVRVVQAFMPLVRQGNGRVVFMSSIAGKISGNFSGAYSASKFATEAIADSLRRELRPWNLSVSVINAAEIETPLLDRYEQEFKRAKTSLAAVNEKAIEFYGEYYDNHKKTPAKFIGTTQQTDKAIAHALLAPYPKTRYIVASKPMMNSHLYPQMLMGLPTWSVLPDRYFDDRMARSQWPRRLKVNKKK